MSFPDEAQQTEGGLEIDPVPAGGITLRLSGVLSNATAASIWRRVEQALNDATPSRLIVDAARLTYLDGAGMALLVRLQAMGRASGAEVELRGLSPGHDRLLKRFSMANLQPQGRTRTKCLPVAEQVGRTTVHILADLREHMAFLGEVSEALVRAVLNPRKVRWGDLLLAAERGGADALPIVALISWLVGLVLAFQSAMAMRPYGAEIYVANLVTIAMLRELGPLMTAIILAGRSGGAFAAEIGTMKVNDEVAALSTMGLNPIPFLAVPRVLGLTITIPFLTLFSDIVGVLGGATVFLSFEYPLSTYFNQALDSAELRHLLSGLVKSLAFGVTIAGVGCMRGLQTLRGPSAVGRSTTSAVVTSILLIVIIDAILGTIFYYLDF